MNKLFFVFVLLLVVPFVSAENLTTDLRAYYSFDADCTTDDNGNYNGTNNGASSGATGKLGDACDFESTESDYITANAVSGTWINTGGKTFSAWIKVETASNWGFIANLGGYSGANSDEFFGLTQDDSSNLIARAYERGSADENRVTGPAVNTSWVHVAATFDADNHINGFWVNGVSQGTDSTHDKTTTVTSYTFTIGAHTWTSPTYVNYFDGLIDEVGVWSTELSNASIQLLYNNGTGCSPIDNPTGCSVSPPSAGTHGENLEQTAFLEQNGSVSINSVVYAPVISAAVVIPEDTELYASSTIPLLPVASNTADCRVTIDGAEFEQSETSRSLTAGQAGNMLITSFEENVTAGTYDFGVECKRTGGGAFTVDNATLYLHILTSTAGVVIPHTHLNVTSAAASGLITNGSITTSENYTDSGLTRALILEWAASYDYTSSGNITVTTELAGVNCTPIKRYGVAGTLGSVAGACYVDVGNETNSTAYDIKVYASGVGNIENGVFHTKEIIPHINEINSTSLSGKTLAANNSVIDSVDITITGHSNNNLVSEVVIDVLSTSGTQTGSYYLSDGTTNSSIVARTGDENEAGVLGVQYQYVDASGTETLSLVGSCAACSFIGGDLVSYLTDAAAFTPNTFIVTAKSIYDDSAINSFTINLSDGRTLSTTTGSISVFLEDDLINVTFAEQGSTVIPFYANTTLNHNKSGNLDQYLTPYTKINATFAGAAVNNFTLNGTSTTSGAVYVRLESETKEFSLTDAVSAGGTNLSDQSQNVTGAPYLEYYTFALLVANTFNFTLLDEITEAVITENMTVEVISDVSAGTYTTTNGSVLLELLTPSNYTIRYYSTDGSNYTQRDYIQVLQDRERYDIDLYSILNSESVDMVVTIKDTSGDPVQDAIVKLLRYYVSCNCYNVVEMARTSAAGESYFVVDNYDGHYKFSVEYEGATEFLSSSPENFVAVGGVVTRGITINLGSAYFESFRKLTDVARTLTYNNATKGLAFTWNDPSGIVTKGCLYAEYLEGVHYTAVTPNCQEASTGSVVLTLNNSVASYKYYAELETSTTYSDYVVFSGTIDELVTSLLQGNVGLGAFLGAGVILVMALMFSFSAIAVVIITVVGVIGMAALGVASLSTVFITGFATLIIGLAAYLMRS